MANSRTANNSQLKTGDSVDISSEDLTEMRLIVVGRTGAGKSSTINTIAGKKQFVARLTQLQVTKACQAAEINFDDMRLLVVDTPGLYNGYSKTEIQKIMGITSPGFHAVVVVVKVGRFTAEDKICIKVLADTFGQEFYKWAVIVFTSTDTLEADGMSFDEYIEGHIHSELKKIIGECGDRTVGFNNFATEEARKSQVRKLMEQLQNIKMSNKKPYYTNAEYISIENQIQEERQKRVKDKKKTEEQATREIRKEIEENLGFGRKPWCVLL